MKVKVYDISITEKEVDIPEICPHCEGDLVNDEFTREVGMLRYRTYAIFPDGVTEPRPRQHMRMEHLENGNTAELQFPVYPVGYKCGSCEGWLYRPITDPDEYEEAAPGYEVVYLTTP